MQRQRRQVGVGALFLAAQVFRVGLDNIPPVTLGFMGLNTAVYLGLVPLAGLRSAGAACASYYLVWKRKQWKRIFFSSFYHLDDMHLYFNMASFMWKGISLERRFGARKFFVTIAIFVILTQMTMLGLNWTLSIVLDDTQWLRSCAAGFSAVLFGLKVITTKYMGQDSVSVMGLPITVPAQISCWVELILIQVLVPNASFTGHLAGILVGLTFVKGPLESIIDFIDNTLAGHYPSQGRRPTYTYRSGVSGTRDRVENRNRGGENRNRGGETRNGGGETRNRGGENRDRSRANNGDDAASLQEAIRRSLRETTSDSRRTNERPPGYGWNIPEDDPALGHAIRESLKQQGGKQSHNISGSTPYPIDDTGTDRPPYPMRDNAANQMHRERNGGNQMPLYPPQTDKSQDHGGDATLPYPPTDAELRYPPAGTDAELRYPLAGTGIYPNINDLEYQSCSGVMPSAPPIVEVTDHNIRQRNRQNKEQIPIQTQEQTQEQTRKDSLFEVD